MKDSNYCLHLNQSPVVAHLQVDPHTLLQADPPAHLQADLLIHPQVGQDGPMAAPRWRTP